MTVSHSEVDCTSGHPAEHLHSDLRRDLRAENKNCEMDRDSISETNIIICVASTDAI